MIMYSIRVSVYTHATGQLHAHTLASCNCAGGPRGRHVALLQPGGALCGDDDSMTGLALNYSGSEAVVTLNDGCVFRLDTSAAGMASTNSSSSSSNSNSDNEVVPTVGSLQHFIGHRNCQTFKQV